MQAVKHIHAHFCQVCLILIAAALLVCFNHNLALCETGNKKQLLVLHSYHKGYKWTDDITVGIELALRDSKVPVKAHYEYMDTKRVATADYFTLLHDTYRYKFANMKFDAVIVSDNDAFKFMLTYRKSLFPGAPLIFCGINNFSPEQLNGQRQITGVNESADIQETLELALKLHPGANTVVVINDTTTTGLIIHKELERVVPLLGRPVKLSFLEDTTVPEIEAAIQKLGSDTVVLFALFSRDRNGRFIEYDETISRIASTSQAPIYGVWDFYLGLGVVGGKLTSGFLQGETAGRLASRVLTGDNTDQIPVITQSPNRYMFDFRQMQRFGLSVRDIPADSTIINRPASLYTLSKNVFWSIIAALAGSVMIIVFLLYNTVRRIKAEERSRRLAAIVDSSDDAIIGKTLDGMITSWNRGAEKIFGYSESEMIGKNITMLVPEEHQDATRTAHDMIRRGEHIDHMETVRQRKNGELLDMSLSYSPVSDNKGQIVAFSTIGRDITERKHNEQLQLANALINRELEIAQQIQQSFLPNCPEWLPGLQMACVCEPAAHVGGDYYDLFYLPDGRIDVVIADITGHCVGSGLLMTETRSVLHAKAASCMTPAGMLSDLNNLLLQDLSKTEMQMSMFYARIDTARRLLTYANAGHCRPLFFSARQGAASELDADGMIIGVLPDVIYEEATLAFESGDMLFLYTDGIIEGESSSGELFGIERLTRLIEANSHLAPAQLIRLALGALTDFTGTATRADDVAMFAIRFRPEQS